MTDLLADGRNSSFLCQADKAGFKNPDNGLAVVLQGVG